jgi:hypothetical protein
MDLLLSTIQGSILETTLYTFFVSLVFDLKEMLFFTDDSYVHKVIKCLASLKMSMEKLLEWLKQSDLKVNK